MLKQKNSSQIIDNLEIKFEKLSKREKDELTIVLNKDVDYLGQIAGQNAETIFGELDKAESVILTEIGPDSTQIEIENALIQNGVGAVGSKLIKTAFEEIVGRCDMTAL